MKKVILVLLMCMSMMACTRIETGEVGLRIDMSKQIQSTELLAGSWNQTIVGDVLTLPIRDVSVPVENLTPLAKDNSTMKDVDLTVIYNINPSVVSDLYTNKSKAFHAHLDGDTYLMYSYIKQTARNAMYKVARKYDALNMNDSRAQIEQEVQDIITQILSDEKLSGITVSQVRVGAMTPADAIKASSDALVKAKNEKLTKDVEVEIAKKEAERIQALNANVGAISYMNAQSLERIAKGVESGKVQTIIVPVDFKGIVNIK
jgi:regulator of protease activity HflC (stomatin/prohibitin superfamily)